MRRYHTDTLKFMAQPPDEYELFRQRLRNLPELSARNTDPLFHTIEADLASMVGGDLALVPPLLRKYWDRFLQPRQLHTWRDAATWYLSLKDEDKRLADQYLGFQHLDLRQYQSWKQTEPSELPDSFRELIRREEQQRLIDFARDFDLVIEDPDQHENFNFWRGYLRDMLRIYQRYPELMDSLSFSRTEDVRSALKFLTNVQSLSPRDKAKRIASQMQREPLLAHFLSALDNKTLLELFSLRLQLPPEASLKGTTEFVKKLQRFSPIVEEIVSAGKRSPSAGMQRLKKFLPGINLKNRSEADLFFGMLREADNTVTKAVLKALDKDTFEDLIKATPVMLRFTLDPKELSAALGVTEASSNDEIFKGINLMVKHPSGNFRIDEPYFDEAYRVIAVKSQTDTKAFLRLLADSPLPLERFVYSQPNTAAAIFLSDVNLTADLVEKSDPVVFPPARFVYTLAFADPDLAAKIVGILDKRGKRNIVLESLAYMAYDKPRLDANPSLQISLEKDGLFLKALVDTKGVQWLADTLQEVAQLYRQRIQQNEVDADFLAALVVTLNEAAFRLPDRSDWLTLQRTISGAFRQ
jgi:hypothetical protein